MNRKGTQPAGLPLFTGPILSRLGSLEGHTSTGRHLVGGKDRRCNYPFHGPSTRVIGCRLVHLAHCPFSASPRIL